MVSEFRGDVAARGWEVCSRGAPVISVDRRSWTGNIRWRSTVPGPEPCTNTAVGALHSVPPSSIGVEAWPVVACTVHVDSTTLITVDGSVAVS